MESGKLNEPGSSRRGPTGERLTPREIRVARAVAEGWTNREVAAALFISPRTVDAHLSRIYRKLGLRSRSELAKLVAEGRLEDGLGVRR